jgi:hypothetical protein
LSRHLINLINDTSDPVGGKLIRSVGQRGSTSKLHAKSSATGSNFMYLVPDAGST